MAKKYEAHDLHPRIAHWIDEQKLLYIHEYRSRGGQIDFLTICPRSGCVSIIEGKMTIDHPMSPISQVNNYERSLGVADICKMVFSYNPVPDWYWNIYENSGVELYVTGDDAPAARIKRIGETYTDFWSVFDYFYERPMRDISRNTARPSEPISRTFTVFDLQDYLEERNDDSLKASFRDGWGVLELPLATND